MATMKTFAVPHIDSVKREFGSTKQAKPFACKIKMVSNDHYHLFQGESYIGFILGFSKVCGGKLFAFIPEFDSDREVRISSLSQLVWPLSEGQSVEDVVQELLAYED